MPTPDFQLLLLPLLECLQDGEVHSFTFIEGAVERYVELSDQPLRFGGEVGASITQAQEHLLKAGLINLPASDQVMITALGKRVLSKRPNSLDLNFLCRLPVYLK